MHARSFFIGIALTFIGHAASAQYLPPIQPLSPYGTGSNPSSHYVHPHTNSNGTYTEGHYRTNPNHTQTDNYNTRGNYNPHNGEYGTRTPRY